MNTVFLKVTSALCIGGIIREVGHIFEVAEEEAKSLLHRGVCALATAEDVPDAPAPEPDEDVPDDAAKTKK